MADLLPHSSMPLIDETAISRFVELAFNNLEGFVAVREIPESGTGDRKARSAYHRPAELVEVLNTAAPRAAEHARGVFAVPATVDKPGSAKAADIRQTGVILIDIDGGDIDGIVTYLTRHLGKASLEVASGGKAANGQIKRHLYWKLIDAASGPELQRVRALRESIALKVGADPSFKSLHQPIRVPGTIHGKNGIRTPVSIIAQNPCNYSLDALEHAARAMRSMVAAVDLAKLNQGAARGSQILTLAHTKVRAGGADGITRFDALSKVIGHWIRIHRQGKCTRAEAWTAVVDYNAAMIVPPWPEDRLQQEFEALVHCDIASHGSLTAGGVTPDAGITPLSEDALAFGFANQHERVWRRVAGWDAWFQWQNGKWTRDETGAVREHARLVCRANAHAAEKPHESRHIASDKTIAAVLRIVASDPRIAAAPSAFDSRPWLLNTPAGIFDLKSGELLPHEPDLMITQMTTASPGAGCPRWLAFLDEITNGNRDLQAYLARLAGYCLTGSTAEQIFAFLHGSGANGKSVFLQTLAAVMGDYAKTATNETFMATRTDRHLTELAGLRAARLVIVPETEQGRAWAEARIKAVTGGETIRANFMRQDHFEFTPQFKLIVAGNHRPALTGIGEAMRRRLHLVPFTVTIPAGKRDMDLAAKLLAEQDGILSWMIEGCQAWQQKGLSPPFAVSAAVDAYFTEEDTVGLWIGDRCNTGPEFRATARDLFRDWSGWAQAAGHDQGSQKSLGAALRERGFNGGKVNGQRGWIGISPGRGSGHAEGPP